MKNMIYYFSSTGNSLKIARDLAGALGETAIVPMPKLRAMSVVETEAGRIGLVFPVYYGGPPLLVAAFLRKLRAPAESYIFAVANCGYTFGTTLRRADRLLRRNGLALAAGYVLKMPDNYAPMLDPGKPEEQRKLFAAEEEAIAPIAEDVRAGRHLPYPADFFPINWLSSGLAYPLISAGFHMRDRRFWLTADCNACGTCAKVCPVGNIAMAEGRPAWAHQCQFCLACLQWCPKQALQYGKGTVKRDRYHHPEAKVKEFIHI